MLESTFSTTMVFLNRFLLGWHSILTHSTLKGDFTLKIFSDAPRPMLIMKSISPESFELGKNQLLVGSGKSGINLILGHMRASKYLVSKNSQIFVPQ